MTHERSLSIPADEGRIQCRVCPRECILAEGKAGWCHTRTNRGGHLTSLTYGQLADLQIDWIEEKALYHFHPGSRVLALGTPGCTLECPFCQNWEISQALRLGLSDPRPVVIRSPKQVVREACDRKCRALVWTFTEACVALEFVLDVAEQAHEWGLLNVIVSNGYMTARTRETLGPWADGVRIDLKGPDDRFYQTILGAAIGPVWETIAFFRQQGIWIEISTVIIPGLTDSHLAVGTLANTILRLAGPDTPWHLMRFLPAYRLSRMPPASLETMRLARRVALDSGLRYVYISNVPGVEERSSFCPQCGALLARRGVGTFSPLPVRCRCGQRVAGRGLAPV